MATWSTNAINPAGLIANFKTAAPTQAHIKTSNILRASPSHFITIHPKPTEATIASAYAGSGAPG